MNLKKILGIVAVIGIGAIIYSQYKKSRKKNQELSDKTTVVNKPNYAKAMEKTKTELRGKTKTALKGKFADRKQQNQ
jgi:hypothetical protein